MKKISIISPTLNEVENVQILYSEILAIFKDLRGFDFELIFVDDRSSDGTIDKIKKIISDDFRVKLLVMSRRYGEQKCLMAGYAYATGDAAITMDSDLQHPPKYISQMIEAWESGKDVVIMVREASGTGSHWKAVTEILFYKILNFLSSTPIYYRYAGFSLVDRKVVESIRKFGESEPFIRGIIGSLGYETLEIYYQELHRENGKTKYNLARLISLALSGILSFSISPLYLALYAGLASILFAKSLIVFAVICHFMGTVELPGWTSLITIISLFSGVQLTCIGIIGVYIGKIFIETKKRPVFSVWKSYGFEKNRIAS